MRESQVVALAPEAVAQLRPDRPLTWISGRSATSDIEFDRVDGVDGPRTLDVILVGDRFATSATRRPTHAYGQ